MLPARKKPSANSSLASSASMPNMSSRITLKDLLSSDDEEENTIGEKTKSHSFQTTQQKAGALPRGGMEIVVSSDSDDDLPDLDLDCINACTPSASAMHDPIQRLVK